MCLEKGVSLDSDDFEIKRERPLVWRTPSDQQNFTNTTMCRNSVQGMVLIVDDRGVLCQRADLLGASGCCDPDATSASAYNCDTCTDSHCCSVYEHCVSCCLNPDKVRQMPYTLSIDIKLSFNSVIRSNHFSNKYWLKRLDASGRCSPLLVTTSSCVWPNAGRIRIRCSTRTSIVVRAPNIATD